MGARAAGIYLRTLAEMQRITQSEAAAVAEVQPKYIWRLAEGEIAQPSAATLYKLCVALNGSWDDLGALLDGTDANGGQAKAIAHLVAEGIISPESHQRISRAAPADLDAAAEHLRARARALREQ